MKKVHPPQYLPLNVIDRQFLVPESDDFLRGSYIPMTIAAVVHPRVMPPVEALQEALILLDDKYPQYRLSYTLDPTTPRWVCIPVENRIEYLKERVQKVEVGTVDEHLLTYIQNNLSPLENPFKVFIYHDSICIHMYHPLGDATFFCQLVASLLIALFKPDRLEQDASRFFIPLGEVVTSNLPQTIKVFGYLVKRMREKATNYISGLLSTRVATDSEQKSIYQPTVSGTKMHVAHFEIPPNRMAQIQLVVQNLHTDQKISLNTYFQIYLAFRMNEMGLVDWPIELTTLVNLRRYSKDPKSFYPGNCIGNVRLSINKASFTEACIDYQTRLTKQINNAYPLTDIVGTWFLALAGDTAFKRAVRDWYLKISLRERRFFTFTNAGRLDEIFEPVIEDILPDVKLFSPIMGSAPLVIGFYSLNNYGHFSVTYKPDILSMKDICRIIDF